MRPNIYNPVRPFNPEVMDNHKAMLVIPLGELNDMFVVEAFQ